MIRQLLGLPIPKGMKLEQQIADLDELSEETRKVIEELGEAKKKLVKLANGALQELRRGEGDGSTGS